MRILITLQRRGAHRYLVNLSTKSLIAQVRDLISDQKYAKAIDLVYYGGLLEREIVESDIPEVAADLMLSDRNANWDVKR